jgi:hypothetical protein
MDKDLVVPSDDLDEEEVGSLRELVSEPYIH